MNDIKFDENGKKTRRSILIFIKLSITFAILYYVFNYYIDFNHFLTAFKNIKLWLLLVLIVITLAFRYLSAYQIHYYFHKVFGCKLGTKFVFKAQLISSFYGLVLPGDLAGGLITWFIISEKSGEKTASASVIIFLRLMGIITLAAFTAIGFVFEKKLIELDLRAFVIAIAVICLLMFVPFVSSRAAAFMKQLSGVIIQITPVANWRHRFVRLSNKLWDCMITCTKADPVVIFWTLTISVLSHIFSILFTYLLMIMVGIQLPFHVSVWLIGVINLVQLLPISFAGLGVRDISIIYLLGEFYRVKPETSEVLSTFFLFFNLMLFFMGAIAIWLKSSDNRQMNGQGIR